MSHQKSAKMDLPTFIRKQLHQDPQLPRPEPTVSAWQTPANPGVSSAQSAQLPEEVDYVVIGSGIAGLGVTKELLTNPKSKSKTVTVLDARTVCSSATGRNGGQLTRIPPTRHTFMMQEFGAEQAKKIVQLTRRGLEEMRKLVVEQGPEFVETSHLTELEKFFGYYDQASWDETVESVKLYDQEIPEDRGAYQLVSKEECETKYGLKGVYGGLRFPAGVCSPYNIVTGTFANLLKRFSGRLTMEANTPVTSIDHNGSQTKYPYLVKTPRGLIKAANVIHCTNGFAGHLLPGLRGKMYPRRGTMSVQDPGSKFPDMGKKQSWSFYYTPTYDEKTGRVETGRYYAFQHKDTRDLWLGGNKDTLTGFITTDDTTIDRSADENLRGVFPKLFAKKWVADDWKARQTWSGIMCYTGDHVPFVGKIPASMTGRSGQGEWIAAGWNTYGMTNGLLCATALAKMILEVDVSDWFPEPYIITDARLAGPRFAGDAVLKDFFDRMGAHDIKAKL